MENENKRTVLGQTLARLRKAHGLTQEQVAELLKIKRSTYAYYERNITPTTETIRKLAAMFSVSTHELMYGEPDNVSDCAQMLRDDSSIFAPPIERPLGLNYPQLTLQEKQFVSRFRMLPVQYRYKIMHEVDDLLDKVDD